MKTDGIISDMSNYVKKFLKKNIIKTFNTTTTDIIISIIIYYIITILNFEMENTAQSVTKDSADEVINYLNNKIGYNGSTSTTILNDYFSPEYNLSNFMSTTLTSSL